MKNNILLLALACFSLQAAAQTFGPVGSKWVYCYAVNAVGGAAGLDTLVVESVAETHFDTLPCRELRIKYCYSHANFGCGLVATFNICQDNKQVYYQEGDSLHLLYDFAALPGDTLRIRYPFLLDTFNQEAMDSFFIPPARPYFDLVIVDTGTLHLNGQNLRTQTFAHIYSDDDYFGPSWFGSQFLEGIGSTGGWLLPRAIGGLQEEHIPLSLISFMAPANAYRYENSANPCLTSGSETPLPKATLTVLPTLFQDRLTVLLNENLPSATLYLYDQTGRLVKAGYLVLGSTEIDTATLPPGFYTWTVIAAGKNLKNGKCIKQP